MKYKTTRELSLAVSQTASLTAELYTGINSPRNPGLRSTLAVQEIPSSSCTVYYSQQVHWLFNWLLRSGKSISYLSRFTNHIIHCNFSYLLFFKKKKSKKQNKISELLLWMCLKLSSLSLYREWWWWSVLYLTQKKKKEITGKLPSPPCWALTYVTSKAKRLPDCI